MALGGLKDVITGETLCDEKNPIMLERMEFPDPVIKVIPCPPLSLLQPQSQPSLVITSTPKLALCKSFRDSTISSVVLPFLCPQGYSCICCYSERLGDILHITIVWDDAHCKFSSVMPQLPVAASKNKKPQSGYTTNQAAYPCCLIAKTIHQHCYRAISVVVKPRNK